MNLKIYQLYRSKFFHQLSAFSDYSYTGVSCGLIRPLKGLLMGILSKILQKIFHRPLTPKERLIQILESLFKIYSPSRKEQMVGNMAMEFLRRCGFEVARDNMGNVLGVRGQSTPYPLLNAHLDTCQRPSDADKVANIRYDKKHDRFFLENAQIAGDDKAGLGIVLWLAENCSNDFKVLLTVQEELGQNGVQNIPPEFYRDVCWAFSLDRKGSGDIIPYYWGRRLCPNEFVQELIRIGMESHIILKEACGTMADTYYISQYCNAVNLSVGFYNAHSSNDYVQVEETFHILRFVERCMDQKQRLIMPMAENDSLPSL